MTETGEGCAGREIQAAWTMFGTVLTEGCRRFSEQAKGESDPARIIELNAACVMFGTAAWEAEINEVITLYQVAGGKYWGGNELPHMLFLEKVQNLQKKLRVSEKWDLIASATGGTLWDSSAEPFQTYETIVALRNEIVHYKAEPFARDDAPTNRIKGLLNRFVGPSPATFVEDDVSVWVSDLLGKPALGEWISEHLEAIHSSRLFQMLIRVEDDSGSETLEPPPTED